MPPPIVAAAPKVDTELEAFRGQIDAYVNRIGVTTNGVVKWLAAQPYELRRDGGALVAVITNAKLAIVGQDTAGITLDRIEVRRTGTRDDGKLIDLQVTLPKQIVVTEPDGSEDKVTLDGAKATALVDAATGLGRESTLRLDHARFEHGQTGVWVNLGPVAISSTVTTDGSGGWSGPVSLGIDKVEFFVPQAVVGGTLDKISYTGKSEGRNWDELQKFRQEIDRINARQPDQTGSARTAAMLELFPHMSALFHSLTGTVAMDKFVVRVATGEALISLDSASITTDVAGLDTDMASLRFAIRHDGLQVSPTLLGEAQVAHMAVFDLALENLSTESLRSLLTAAAKMKDGAETSEADKATASRQAQSAVAMLNPTLRINSIAFETRDVGMAATGQAKGSPISPQGYSAQIDLSVRGFDAIPQLSDAVPFMEYMPVLREIGIPGTAPDGTPRLGFQIISAPPKWFSLNGNDLAIWFAGASAKGNAARVLRPADPPMQGADVKAAQRALSAAKMPVGQDGVYGPGTAVAVARFQKQNRLNVSGAIDPATRQKLGIKG